MPLDNRFIHSKFIKKFVVLFRLNVCEIAYIFSMLGILFKVVYFEKTLISDKSIISAGPIESMERYAKFPMAVLVLSLNKFLNIFFKCIKLIKSPPNKKTHIVIL